MLESVTSAALTSALDGLTQRQRAIADNIANVNTPGYHSQRVQFEAGARRVGGVGRRPRGRHHVALCRADKDRRQQRQPRHGDAARTSTPCCASSSRASAIERPVRGSARRPEDQLMTFDAIGIAGTSLTVHRKWLDAIADNLANVNTAAPTSGPAFQARFVEAQAGRGDLRRLRRRDTRGRPHGRLVYEPDNPLADADGYVRYPDIDMGEQMGQLIMAQRGYQANAAGRRPGQAPCTRRPCRSAGPHERRTRRRRSGRLLGSVTGHSPRARRDGRRRLRHESGRRRRQPPAAAVDVEPAGRPGGHRQTSTTCTRRRWRPPAPR